MAYIVVSDVHLGSDSCNQPDFCEFLKWVHALEKEENIAFKDKNITIKKPDKIILLGDILELWDPKNGNRDYVIQDGILPFSILTEINCEKVYVVGNHDDYLSELQDNVNSVELPNKTKFEIYNKHYPDNLRGLKIGCNHYFFLHGQQFDEEQKILKIISNLIGESWNPLGWFQDLFNTSFTKKHWGMNLMIFSALFLGGIFYFFSDSKNTITWTSLTGFLSSLLEASLGGLWASLTGSLSSISLTSASISLKTIILSLLALGGLGVIIYLLMYKLIRLTFLIIVLVTGILYFSLHANLFILVWAALTGFFALSSIPGVVGRSQRGFYNSMKPQDKTAQQIIEDKYYKKDKDTIRANRVVFGHTHFASSYLLKDTESGNKLFINSGGWYGRDTIIEQYLFSWNNVQEKDSINIKRYLKEKFGINRVENAELKIVDDRTIRMFSEENSIDIMLDEKKEKAILKINNNQTYNLSVKKEKGNLNIYYGKMRYANTFVYIDETGAYILRWNECGKIECIESFPDGESVITAPTA